MKDKYKYALLVDNMCGNPQTELILKAISTHPEYDVTIFSITKEKMVPNNCAVLHISNYFAWRGPSIITSSKTLEKSAAYPAVGPKIIIGPVKYKDYLNAPALDLSIINKIVSDNDKD
jgi:hypothetical protein